MSENTIANCLHDSEQKTAEDPALLEAAALKSLDNQEKLVRLAREIEREHIRRIMTRHRGSLSEVAREAGVSRTLVQRVVQTGTGSERVLAVVKKKVAELERQELKAYDRLWTLANKAPAESAA